MLEKRTTRRARNELQGRRDALCHGPVLNVTARARRFTDPGPRFFLGFHSQLDKLRLSSDMRQMYAWSLLQLVWGAASKLITSRCTVFPMHVRNRCSSVSV